MEETEAIKNAIGAVREALEDFTEEEAMKILTMASNDLPVKSDDLLIVSAQPVGNMNIKEK